MNIHLRTARTEDLQSITDIYAYHVDHGLASFEELAPDLTEMTRRFDGVKQAGYPWLVAVSVADGEAPDPELEIEAGEVVGYAYASNYRGRPAYRFSVENSVYVSPDAIGHGLGRRLLGRLIDECAHAGYRQMIAVIGDSQNHASIGLHKALGFRHTGTFESVGFKHGRWVDSVLMQREIGSGDSALPADV